MKKETVVLFLSYLQDDSAVLPDFRDKLLPTLPVMAKARGEENIKTKSHFVLGM